MKRIYYEHDPHIGASVAVYSPDFGIGSTERELPYLIALDKGAGGQTEWSVVSEYKSQAGIIRRAIHQFDAFLVKHMAGDMLY